MFRLAVHNELSCLAQAQQQGVLYAKKGSMVGYQGRFKFDKVLLDPNGGNVMAMAARHMGRKLTGENLELMKVQGQGILYLADLAQHVTVVGLNNGESISVESENLLALTDGCKYGINFFALGTVSQKGLFTSKITGQGQGSQVAIMTNGNPIILDTPCVVDPDAIVAWTGPDPTLKAHMSFKMLIGQTSGESYALEFKQPGHKVVIQPYERESGFKLAIDDKRYQPEMQNSAFQNTQNGFQQMGQQFGGEQIGSQGQFGSQSQGNGMENMVKGALKNFLG
ncbi:AIM24 family protein [Alkaliphilus sp. B6464]|uniref:AIM24 family protein n=1 Tax=Alkaliphilus sp. B6464 TaxID=2731219 RepID=UPI001BA7CD45|nr:AIM24 family protein [Alkaliphilus sp. B6464]QUH21964.1 AIM24 family protein [Alkaliphilus sp. B6464]